MNGLRLSPEETAAFLSVADYADGFADGAKAFAERMKKRKLDQILAARQAAPQKEAVDGPTTA